MKIGKYDLVKLTVVFPLIANLLIGIVTAFVETAKQFKSALDEAAK